MTDAQRHLFANKMSEMPEMSKYSQGTESYQQFAIHYYNQRNLENYINLETRI